MTVDQFLEAALGDYHAIVSKYKERDYIIPKALKKVDNQLPEGFLLLNEYHPIQDRFLEYVEKRNLDLELLEERGVGYCVSGRFAWRLIFPFLNPHFEYFVGRSILPGVEPKYLNPTQGRDINTGKGQVIYNKTALLGERAYLGEGVLDALVWDDEGICCLGWQMSGDQFSMIIQSNIKELYIVPDSGYFKKALILAYKFSDYKDVYIANLDHYPEGLDAQDVGRENVHFEKFKLDMML